LPKSALFCGQGERVRSEPRAACRAALLRSNFGCAVCRARWMVQHGSCARGDAPESAWERVSGVLWYTDACLAQIPLLLRFGVERSDKDKEGGSVRSTRGVPIAVWLRLTLGNSQSVVVQLRSRVHWSSRQPCLPGLQVAFSCSFSLARSSAL
jgi:hypothetical protein